MAHLAEFAGATEAQVVRGRAGTAETAATVQAAATATGARAHHADNAGAAAFDAAATDSSKCGGDVPWRAYAACVCLVLAIAVQDSMACVATGLLAGYLAGSSTAAQQVQGQGQVQRQPGQQPGSSSESDGDSSLVSRSSTAPTGLDLAGRADGTPCTQLPDPEPEGALRDVGGDDGDERRAAPSEPEQDSPAELQQQVKRLKAALSRQEAAARSAMQKSLRVQEQAEEKAQEAAAKKWKPEVEKHRIRAEKFEQFEEQVKQGQIEQGKHMLELAARCQQAEAQLKAAKVEAAEWKARWLGIAERAVAAGF